MKRIKLDKKSRLVLLRALKSGYLDGNELDLEEEPEMIRIMPPRLMKTRAEIEERLERLENKLRELGCNPDDI